MSVYDFVGEQEVISHFHHYNIGDEIDLQDGLYLTNEGWFVVEQGKVFITGHRAFTKWGDRVVCSELLEKYNPITKTLSDMDEGSSI